MVGMRLHHLALGAQDVERVAPFYRDLLALPEVAQHRLPDGTLRSVWLDLGGAVLMIERTAEPARRGADVGAGLFLLALACTAERREAWERSLESAGVRIEGRTEHTSYFRDPEGNRVAISSYPFNIFHE